MIKFQELNHSEHILFMKDADCSYIVVSEQLMIKVGKNSISLAQTVPSDIECTSAQSIYEFLPFLKNCETNFDEAKASQLMFDQFPSFLYEMQMIYKNHNYHTLNQKQKRNAHLP